MWDRSFPIAKSEEWAGTYTLPRELTVEDNHLIQKPVREVLACRHNPVSVPLVTADKEEVTVPGISGNVIELRFNLKPGDAKRAGVKLFCDKEHETVLYYDREEGLVVFDRRKSGVEITGRDTDVNRRVCSIEPKDSIEFDLFLDVCSLEAFIGGGKHTMTGNVFPDPELATGIRFFAEGGKASFEDIEKYDIR